VAACIGDGVVDWCSGSDLCPDALWSILKIRDLFAVEQARVQVRQRLPIRGRMLRKPTQKHMSAARRGSQQASFDRNNAGVYANRRWVCNGLSKAEMAATSGAVAGSR